MSLVVLETSSKVRISVIAQVLVQKSQGRPDSWLWLLQTLNPLVGSARHFRYCPVMASFILTAQRKYFGQWPVTKLTSVSKRGHLFIIRWLHKPQRNAVPVLASLSSRRPLNLSGRLPNGDSFNWISMRIFFSLRPTRRVGMTNCHCAKYLLHPDLSTYLYKPLFLRIAHKPQGLHRERISTSPLKTK